MRHAIAAALLLGPLGCNVDPPPPDPVTDPPKATTAVAPGPSAATPAAAGPLFHDALRESGIAFVHSYLDAESGTTYKPNHYDHGSGMVAFDVDGDAAVDLYFLNQGGDNALYRNLGDGRFEDVTAAAGVKMGDRICVAATAADYDNDGDQDLYVTSYRGGNALLRNDGGTFEDVAKAAGVGHVGHSSAASFFDADGDGRLDLFVANIGPFTTDDLAPGGRHYVGRAAGFDFAGAPGEPDILYRNRGDGTFEDVSTAAGIADTAWSADVAAADYDADGDMDVYVSNMFGENLLWRNDGGKFTNVAPELLGRTSYGAMGARWLDGNGDGRLDLYVTDMHSDMWMNPTYDLGQIEAGRRYDTNFGPNLEKVGPERMAQARELQKRPLVFGNTFFVQTADGKFQERALEAGLECFWPWGAAAEDLDGDGDVDLFVPAGMSHPWRHWPNALFVNDGSGAFSERGEALGIRDTAIGRYSQSLSFAEVGAFAHSSRAAAALDLEGDGDVDVVTANFNSAPSVFRNDSPPGTWIGLRLQGTKSNRDAIGARVEVEASGRTLVRWVLPSQGYLTQSSRTLLVALPAGAAPRARVRWPSGAVQDLGVLETGKRHDVVEAAGS